MIDTVTSKSYRVLYGDFSAGYCGLSHVPKTNNVLVCVGNDKQTYTLLAKLDEKDNSARSDRKILELSMDESVTMLSP